MGRDTIVRMRLAAMAQTYAPLVETVWANHSVLKKSDKEVLAFEFALTGIDGDCFDANQALNYGPVFSLKFVPQYIREHCEDGANECAGALHNLAEIMRMLRNQHPVQPTQDGVNIDAILRLVGKGKGNYHRAGGVQGFELCPVHEHQYEVLHKLSLEEEAEPLSPGPSLGHKRAIPASPEQKLRGGRADKLADLGQLYQLRRVRSLGDLPLEPTANFLTKDGGSRRSFPANIACSRRDARRCSTTTNTPLTSPTEPVSVSQPIAASIVGFLRRPSIEQEKQSNHPEEPSASQSSAPSVGYALEELHILVKGDGKGRKHRRINLPRSTSVSELRAVLGKLAVSSNPIHLFAHDLATPHSHLIMFPCCLSYAVLQGDAAEVAEAEYWDPEFEEWCELPVRDFEWGTLLPMFPSCCRVRMV